MSHYQAILGNTVPIHLPISRVPSTLSSILRSNANVGLFKVQIHSYHLFASNISKLFLEFKILATFFTIVFKSSQPLSFTAPQLSPLCSVLHSFLNVAYMAFQATSPATPATKHTCQLPLHSFITHFCNIQDRHCSRCLEILIHWFMLITLRWCYGLWLDIPQSLTQSSVRIFWRWLDLECVMLGLRVYDY